MTPAGQLARTDARPVTPLAILASRLDALAARLTDSVDPAARREVRELADLAGGLDPYVARWTSPESAALRALHDMTRTHDWAAHEASVADLGLEQEMLSGHVEGQLLKTLVRATRARRVLEIGMFTGYAALAMAEELDDGGCVVTCEVDAAVAALAADAFAAAGVADRIEVRVGPAAATLAGLAAQDATFDLIFLDADKAGYIDYVRTVLDARLLAPHGLLCVDNTLMQGEPWTATTTPNGTAIAHFNEVVAADPRVEQVILPVRDGLTLVRWADPAGTAAAVR